MPCPEKFRETLIKHRIPEPLIQEIHQDFEGIVSKSQKKVKASYFKRAIDILEEQIEPERLISLLADNACCKGGAREKASKSFAKEHKGKSLEEKLALIPAVPHMGRPALNEDGSITIYAVHYSDGEKFQCACPNYNGLKRDYPVSRSYCFCCAGHFRHHYEIMLEMKLRPAEIISSPLDSEGNNPCVIRLVPEE